MKKVNNEFVFSASDLSGFINCNHLTQLDRKAAEGLLEKPVRKNRLAEALQELGNNFEQTYLEELRQSGKTVVEINKDSTNPFNDTVDAMKHGADVIYQARLKMDAWAGWADFLIKTETPSNLGDWSYEVLDTKLSTETKAGTILQITLYSEMINSIQGSMPAMMHVQHPNGSEKYRILDYLSYYRLVKKKFLEKVNSGEESYPHPVNHCDVCSWWPDCNQKRREDDHLQFVAGLGRVQKQELEARQISTLEALAEKNIPLDFEPDRGSKKTYEKLCMQAKLQKKVRETNQPAIELLPRVPEFGFFNLPEPTEDDIYLDLEGDPLVRPSGREYIFGYVFNGDYYINWAESEEAEKQAFETFIDFAFEKYQTNPGMRIYHFGAYETSAFKRLMLRYGTRIEQVEVLLRSQTFVDLHQIVRQSLQAGVEKYSLKDLEKYHGFLREADLRTVGPQKVEYEALLEKGIVDTASDEMRNVIQTYNEDDCRSTQALHVWLCKLRQELVDAGEEIPFKEREEGEANERQTQHQERIKPIFERLIENLPVDRNTHTKKEQLKYLVAHMLDWYGREVKKLFWDKYRIQQTLPEELFDEPLALTGLQFADEREQANGSVVDTYSYVPQECDIKNEDTVIVYGTKISLKVVAVDREKCTIKIRKGPRNRDVHPSVIFQHNHFPADTKINRIVNIASLFSNNRLDNPILKTCAVDLLMQSPPRIAEPVIGDKSTYEGRLEWLLKLKGGVLPIQGPPGTGKTYNSSRLIVGLIKEGKRVGVSALSHKVITSLLKAIQQAAEELDVKVDILQKPGRDGNGNQDWTTTGDYEFIANQNQNFNVIAGTSSMWAHPALEKTVDYLFIDEAGQLSLIDTLVCTSATENLVLIGDPQQLKQPVQGIHPDGIDVSALEHIFQGAQTITEDQGIFLGTTWRMHPDICSFNSDLFYDSKLTTIAGLENQKISGNTKFAGVGLFFKPVEHSGRTTSSKEEAEEVARIFYELIKGDVYWEDANGNRQILGPEHIKIITPYNSQRYEIMKRLDGFTEVGTVDKFQGQEAPVVIYSMVTSATDDIPRGMDFLFSPNRLNVAVSRARAAFVLVGSPKLLEAECKTPEQMKLANAFAMYLEKAQII